MEWDIKTYVVYNLHLSNMASGTSFSFSYPFPDNNVPGYEAKFQFEGEFDMELGNETIKEIGGNRNLGMRP